MRNLILGTAGHIDHGKTALVRALTGVDTDRLAEEKSRGITIDLGFAELAGEDVRFGVVDVPGHEGFVRNMLAGATGMDVVLLVVAADEGVMPQTREHLAIVSLLAVRRLVVALTKVDLVEEEWLELVTDDVRDLLRGGPYGDAPIVPTSAETGVGLDQLRATLLESGLEADEHSASDVLYLPIDRVFSVVGTGTVVTGTIWWGEVRTGDRVRILPGSLGGRVRALQVHGAEAEVATSGTRAALALTGDGMDTESLSRGQAVVASARWEESLMLTVRVRVLEDSAWTLEYGQRVRLHVGTAEVMARCVLLDEERLDPGEVGWAQLRLEAPVVARARQRFVLRSYSPMDTFAGGEIAEVHPPKRRPSADLPRDELAAVLEGAPERAVSAALDLAGTGGVAGELLPVATGVTPEEVADALAGPLGALAIQSDERWVGGAVVAGLAQRISDLVDAVHRDEPFRAGVAVDQLRALLPHGAPRGLVDALLRREEARGEFMLSGGVVARPDFRPTYTAAQEESRDRLRGIFREAGLAPPTLDDLPEDLRRDPAFLHLLRGLQSDGELVSLEADLLICADTLAAAAERTVAELGGRDGLGPADFKGVLPVSRRHLLPILRHFDGVGITRNKGDVRAVPQVSS